MVSAASLILQGLGLMGSAGTLYWLSRPGIARAGSSAALILLPILIGCAPSPAALTITILIEAPIVFGLAALMRFGGGQAALRSCFINALTQPLLHMGIVFLGGTYWWSTFALLEMLTCVIEARLYIATMPSLLRSPGGISKAFAISLCANLVSATAGLLLTF